MTTDLLDAIQSFCRLRILVVGDLLLDQYITGTTERTSPEAPVPVVLVSGEVYMAGGAANVGRNIVAAGASAKACGLIGKDDAGNRLVKKLNEAGVDISGVRQSTHCQTIVKTRVVSQGQQIVRLDHEKQTELKSDELDEAEQYFVSAMPHVDAVIISDYGKGFLTDSILARLFSASVEHQVPVLVDPKGRNYARYHGAFAITPNSREAQEATGISTATEEGLRSAAERIKKETGCHLVVITLGAGGLALLDENDQLVLVPTSAREVFDVTGAGDTFVAWLTFGVASGMPAEDAARLANTAAGIAVARSGPAVVSPLDMRQALAPGRLGKKIINEAGLARLGEELHKQGKKIVLTNGCFDFLHAGHVAFLQQARAFGDVLVLATNTDESIRRLKGAPRPVIAQRQREELLASIEAVDYVTVFTDDTPHEIIARLRPDVLVKGSNYGLDEVEGADLVRETGGDVFTLPIVFNISTSKLVRDRE